MTPARQAEADRVEQDYHWALVTLGLITLVESRALYSEEVPATAQAAGAAGWLRRAVALVMFRRQQASRLALAYYRLVRALRTGATISPPAGTELVATNLEGIRDEYDDLVTAIEREAAALGVDPGEWPQSPPDDSQAADGEPQQPTAPSGPVDPEADYDADEFNDDDEILLEEIANLDAEIERLEREAEEEAELLLDRLGIEELTKRFEQVDPEDTAENADGKRAEVHDIAGKRQASIAMMIAENAARGLSYSLAEMDKRAIGWVRYSRTGTPCGFCAMLLSRGFVKNDGRLFRSRRSARSSVDEDGNAVEDIDRFHPNCQCVAVPVFLPAQLDSELYELNRFYAELWEQEIKGQYSGDEALTEWRRLIRRLAAQQDNPTKTVLAAV